MTATRSFIRYLITEGRCRPGLDAAIPTIRQWRLASLPRCLSPSQVERLIRSCDLRTPMGLRDRAVLLLLSRLGLRCGDVVGLTAEDVDWKHGGLRVTGKGRRPDVLPLPQEVGDALLAYIERGRSENRDRTIFLRARAPHRPLSRIAVTDIVASALRRAGIVDAPTKGAHQLRHSAATNMLRAGVGLHEIGTVLRHRSMATTAIYAKVDVASLAAIAQPWPGRS